jgi:hypothetical protein
VSLKYAVLTMLARESFSGYDLVTRFDGSVGILWHATHPHISATECATQLRWQPTKVVPLRTMGPVSEHGHRRGHRLHFQEGSLRKPAVTSLHPSAARGQEPRSRRPT